MFGTNDLIETRASGRPASGTAREGGGMKTRRGRMGVTSRPAALFHVVLRGCRSEALVRDTADWKKLTGSIETMLFWCGGRIFGCRCEGDCFELALQPAKVPLSAMFRYVTVPYALYFNRTRAGNGQVFRPLRVYRVLPAFRTEFVLWMHRPPTGMGWTADAAYREPHGLSWVDASAVLDELGRGPGARRQYRALRARGVDEDLALVFASPREIMPHVRAAVRPAVMVCKRRQRALLRSVVGFVARHEAVRPRDLACRSRARGICRARCLVTLVGVRCGVALSTIADLLGRDGSTLQESVLRLRERDPQGLLSAAEAICAAMDSLLTDLASADSPKPKTARGNPLGDDPDASGISSVDPDAPEGE